MEEAAPFSPSRAQIESALYPVICELGELSDPQSFIRATFQPTGIMPIALAMYLDDETLVEFAKSLENAK